MATRNPQREAQLDTDWDALREELLAEHYLVAVEGEEKDTVIPIRKMNDEMMLFFEFVDGIPALTVRDPGDKEFKYEPYYCIGDSMGAESEYAKGILEDPDKRLPDATKYQMLNAVLSVRERLVEKVEEKMAVLQERLAPRKAVERLVFNDLVLDDQELERAMFYGATRGMSRVELFEMKERLQKAVKAHFEYGIDAGDTVALTRAQEKTAVASRYLEERFSDWGRLAGRLDWRLSGMAYAKGETMVEDLVKLGEWAKKEPSFAAYRDASLPAWIAQQCVSQNLDYRKIPEGLKYVHYDNMQKVEKHFGAKR